VASRIFPKATRVYVYGGGGGGGYFALRILISVNITLVFRYFIHIFFWKGGFKNEWDVVVKREPTQKRIQHELWWRRRRYRDIEKDDDDRAATAENEPARPTPIWSTSGS
jgi:hypothetical protein